MSKELEALYKLGQIEFETGDYMNDYGYMMSVENTEIYEILENALTPPTEQEVCEALGKHMNEPVWFDDNGEIRISTQWVVSKIYYKGNYVGLNIQVVLPPHLVEMIGKFYKGESK